MISTRENLLVRPWQQRKYEYHKKRVMSATPVIDTKSPPHRSHVAVKLKKLQKENERAQRIERDNLILLQKLTHIMTTHWLDNYLAPQPTFLSRVGIYRPLDSGIDMDDTLTKGVDLAMSQGREMALDSKPKCRKLNCLACSPMRFVEPKLQIPEERVPWDPPKLKVEKRRSRSVPPKPKPETLKIVDEKPKSASSLEGNKTTLRAKTRENPKTEPPSTRKSDKLNPANLMGRPNSISISRGSLRLSVNFPSDATVMVDKKRIGRHVCKCSRGIRH